MSTNATRHPTVRTPSRLFAYASFAIMVGGWVAFAVALVASQQTLDDVWTSVRDLPLIVEGAAWLLGFPFIVGLAIWQASWDEAVRMAVIAVLAFAYTYMFVPRGVGRPGRGAAVALGRARTRGRRVRRA
jgi:hypothetical protein